MSRAQQACLAVFCVLLLFRGLEAVPQGRRVLALLEDTALKSSHSSFFSSLTSQGYQITYSAANAPGLSIKDWDVYLYDKIIVFASSTTEFGGSVDATALLDSVDAGHDLLLATDSDASDELRELAADLGVEFDTKGSAIVDHFNRHDQQSAIITDHALDSKIIFGSSHEHAPVVYRGIAASVSPRSTLVVKALTASDTAYSASSKGTTDSNILAGRDATLMALVQARNNARAVVAGSIDLFSNDFFRATLSSDSQTSAGNEAFCTEVTKWAFHQRGVLLLTNMTHHLLGQHEQLSWYRVSDDIEFSVNIQELTDGQWQPYKANDVQVEFTMLDPHVRATLKPDNKGRFSTHIKVPDAYGVFKFVISYHRVGYTSIEESWQVSVRPFKHNEYERFLLPAFPYYASAFSMMAGFCILSFFFLYHK